MRGSYSIFFERIEPVWTLLWPDHRIKVLVLCEWFEIKIDDMRFANLEEATLLLARKLNGWTQSQLNAFADGLNYLSNARRQNRALMQEQASLLRQLVVSTDVDEELEVFG